MTRRTNAILARAELMADLFRIVNTIEDAKMKAFIFERGMRMVRENIPMPSQRKTR